ncbi:MAG: hypothetical protein ACOC2R_05445 [Spirochaetota bacterium]
MSIECFLRWAKDDSKKSKIIEPEPVRIPSKPADKPFVIEDFDAKKLYKQEWDVPIYGPIRPKKTAE